MLFIPGMVKRILRAKDGIMPLANGAAKTLKSQAGSGKSHERGFSSGMTIETEHLVLRHLTLDDAQALHPVFTDPEGTRFTLRIHTTITETKQWIEAVRAGYEKKGFGPLAVVQKSNGQVIGYCGCGLARLDGREEHEIGYRITRACWGAGFATEAAKATIADAFRRWSLTRLVALIQPGNVASIRVAEKVGMQFQRATVYEGRPMRVYQITPDEGKAEE